MLGIITNARASARIPVRIGGAGTGRSFWESNTGEGALAGASVAVPVGQIGTRAGVLTLTRNLEVALARAVILIPVRRRSRTFVFAITLIFAILRRIANAPAVFLVPVRQRLRLAWESVLFWNAVTQLAAAAEPAENVTLMARKFDAAERRLAVRAKRGGARRLL